MPALRPLRQIPASDQSYFEKYVNMDLLPKYLPTPQSHIQYCKDRALKSTLHSELQANLV